MHASIWWIRRDLRLEDNQALTVAVEGSGQVIPLFILDPNLIEKPLLSPARYNFLIAGLQALDEDLRRRGSRLIVRRGDPTQVLATLAEEMRLRYEKTAIFFEKGYTPYARLRDRRISSDVGLPVHT